jgi:hypothetical protein
VTPDAFINEAIAAGARNGVASLEPLQRIVYLISEAECLCDMEGVDSFLDRYSPRWIPETVAAFEIVGATEIAGEFRSIAMNETTCDSGLDRLNRLITDRAGYNYDSIRNVVEVRLRGVH